MNPAALQRDFCILKDFPLFTTFAASGRLKQKDFQSPEDFSAAQRLRRNRRINGC